jgi:hypothetical protein
MPDGIGNDDHLHLLQKHHGCKPRILQFFCPYHHHQTHSNDLRPHLGQHSNLFAKGVGDSG